jgi:hypothetical protein
LSVVSTDGQKIELSPNNAAATDNLTAHRQELFDSGLLEFKLVARLRKDLYRTGDKLEPDTPCWTDQAAVEYNSV